ncbi:MAG: hypothetical protein ACOYXB_15955 [Bacteroidota bacterium]
MLKDYPIHTFTTDNPELRIRFNTGMKLIIKKFHMLTKGMDFMTEHSLGFQVKMGNITYPPKMFVSFISPHQKNNQVVELNEVFQAEEQNNTVVSIMNSDKLRAYAISMEYEILPM